MHNSYACMMIYNNIIRMFYACVYANKNYIYIYHKSGNIAGGDLNLAIWRLRIDEIAILIFVKIAYNDICNDV